MRPAESNTSSSANPLLQVRSDPIPNDEMGTRSDLSERGLDSSFEPSYQEMSRVHHELTSKRQRRADSFQYGEGLFDFDRSHEELSNDIKVGTTHLPASEQG